MSLTTPAGPPAGSHGRHSSSSRGLVLAIAVVVVGALGVPTTNASTTIRVPEDHPTIQSAIVAASDGDIIDVAPGTYAGPITIDRSITIVGREHDAADPRNNTTILDGGGATVVTVARRLVPGPSLIGLSFRNGNDGISTRSAIILEHSHFTGSQDHLDFSGGGGGVVRNNVFELPGDDAIDVDHPIADLLVEGNQILSAWDDGVEIRLHDDVVVDPVNIVLRGNRIVGSRRDGIQVIDYYQDADRTITIERNLILDVGMAAIGLMDNAISNEDYRAASIRERINVFHNTLVGSDHGISGGDNLIAVGNVLQGHVVGMKNVDGGSIASHNLLWANQTDVVGSVVDEATTVRADPLLDAEHGLGAGSPAIDAGTASFEWGGEVVLTIPPTEYEGSDPDLGWKERPDDGPNTPPIVDAVAIDQPSPTTDALLTVSLSGSDADGDALAYAYRWVRNGVDLPDQTGSTLNLAVPGNGDVGDQIAVRVTVSDGEATSDPVTSSPVTVVNSEPVFDQDLPDRTDAEGAVVSLSAGASDPDGDALIHEATGLPPGVAIDPSTGLISGIVEAGAAAGGPYAVQVTVRDGAEVDATDGFTWTATGTSSVDVAIGASTDDAEEAAAGGMTLKSDDLQLVQARTTQTVGLRFHGVGVPAGATIVEAYVQFRVDEVTTAATSLTVQGQAADDPGTFTTAKRDVSSRPRTTATVEWQPGPWTTLRQVGPDQQTPDLAPVIQAIVDRPGWTSGNAIVLVITGTGRRTADSFNGGWAPVLHVEYASAGGAQNEISKILPSFSFGSAPLSTPRSAI